MAFPVYRILHLRSVFLLGLARLCWRFSGAWHGWCRLLCRLLLLWLLHGLPIFLPGFQELQPVRWGLYLFDGKCMLHEKPRRDTLYHLVRSHRGVPALRRSRERLRVFDAAGFQHSSEPAYCFVLTSVISLDGDADEVDANFFFDEVCRNLGKVYHEFGTTQPTA